MQSFADSAGIRGWAPVAAIPLALFGAGRCVAGDVAVGMVALVLAALLMHSVPHLWREVEGEVSDSRWRFALSSVAVLFIFFRCYRLVPPGLWGDDAINGLLAFDVLDGKIASPFQLVAHSHSRFHALTNYAIAAAFAVFGPTLAALRIPGIVASCLLGALVFGVTRRLFGRSTALFAGVLMASSPMQIAHAKSLLQVVLGAAFQCAGLYGLVRARDEHRWRWVAISALGFAATFYTYHAAKIAPLVALPLLIEATQSRRRSNVVWFSVILICLLPGVASYVADVGALTGRVQAVSVLDEARAAGSIVPLLVSFATTLGIFHVAQGPLRYHWFGPGDDPALTLIAAALVLPGLISSLRRWRDVRHQVLLWWFAVGCAPAFFSVDAPRVYRAFLATPPLFIWAAMPLAGLWRGGRGARWLAILLVAGALVFDFNYYFHRVYTHPGFRWMTGEQIVELARVVRDRGSGWTGYVLSPDFSARHESLRLLSRMWQIEVRDGSFDESLITDDLPGGGAVFVTTDGHDAVADVLASELSQVVRDTRFDPQPRMWWGGAAWPYAAPRGREQPLVSSLAVDRELLQAWRRSGVEFPIRVSCRSKFESRKRRVLIPFHDFRGEEFRAPALCTWRASLVLPQPMHLRIESNHGIELRIDDAVHDPEDLVPAGRHSIAMHGTVARSMVRLKVRWQRQGGPLELIPAAAWRCSPPPGGRPPDSPGGT